MPHYQALYVRKGNSVMVTICFPVGERFFAIFDKHTVAIMPTRSGPLNAVVHIKSDSSVSAVASSKNQILLITRSMTC